METKKFQFEEDVNVRVITSLEHDSTWFYATDVCNALDIANTSQAMDNLDEDEKKMIKTDFDLQRRDIWVISESGLYALVLQSRKPAAKAFRKWVTSVVLPEIRMSGKFTTEKKKERNLQLQNLAKSIDRIDMEIENHKRSIRSLNSQKDRMQKEMRSFINMEIDQLTLPFIG